MWGARPNGCRDQPAVFSLSAHGDIIDIVFLVSFSRESEPDGGQKMSLAGNPPSTYPSTWRLFPASPPTECQSLAERKMSPSTSFQDLPSSFHRKTHKRIMCRYFLFPFLPSFLPSLATEGPSSEWMQPSGLCWMHDAKEKLCVWKTTGCDRILSPSLTSLRIDCDGACASDILSNRKWDT